MNVHDIVVGTTGFLSREVFEIRENNRQAHQSDFLTVGCMGHASGIGLGVALGKASRKVYCLDGDGASIMHLGNYAINGEKKAENFKHILFNNSAHDSTGSQPNAGDNINWVQFAKSMGYKWAKSASTKDDIKKQMKDLNIAEGPAFLEIKVKLGTRKDLGRPTEDPLESKENFMRFC